jgi:amidase
MEILFSSTTQLAAAIRAGQVSATEVLEAHLAQIDRTTLSQRRHHPG